MHLVQPVNSSSSQIPLHLATDITQSISNESRLGTQVVTETEAPPLDLDVKGTTESEPRPKPSCLFSYLHRSVSIRRSAGFTALPFCHIQSCNPRYRSVPPTEKYKTWTLFFSGPGRRSVSPLNLAPTNRAPDWNNLNRATSRTWTETAQRKMARGPHWGRTGAPARPQSPRHQGN